MIISQTPLRISFAGGGTDIKDFYERENGWDINSAIDKYVYVIVKERFDETIPQPIITIILSPLL